MPLHSVRFDDETDQALARVCDATGASPSDVLKRGVMVLAKSIDRKRPVRPFDLYRKLDLGPGGYALGSARNAKQVVRALIKRKHRR
jgi:hypothetical protein